MGGNTGVVVVGGGYAGVMAANRLARAEGVEVTLVNARAEFVQRIRLHQVAAGTHEAVVEYRKVLSEKVRLVVDSVMEIDARGRVLRTEKGVIGYDYLVYAVGSGAAGQQAPGVREFAYPLASLEEAREVRTALEAAPDARVAVVGGGATGIEIAAELAEQGRRVTLICGGVLNPYLHEKGRETIRERLVGLGVTVLDEAKAAEVTETSVRLADGTLIPSQITVWTAGFSVPDLALRSGLSTDATGRLITDDTLTSIDDEHIVAAGDAAAPKDASYRMGCQSAVQLGPQAAETVLSRIAGTQPAPIHVAFAGQCLSLGRRTGVFQISERDDTAKASHLRGRTGGVVKEFICRSTVWQLAFEARKAGKSKNSKGQGEKPKDSHRQQPVAAH
ncbi:FAD-dependent oxidoreductase [Streptomyces roseirectus]|uniref:FAD-dependent oxidoreductase n=1 Tax=Streptomyces roseirectus TaxID=2768066 RepID=A0A7H0IGJ7_9ACTN|nr:FAD-dependent oxidoreductase [Streptomyces roseirectus]QNP71913.1 FAD-dependent oxidoreductase [Streptomyces roseirectus]